MISDGDLYRLAIFLGSCAMMMIVLYHFLDVNSSDNESPATKPVKDASTSASSDNAGKPVATTDNGK
ncbi:Oligosaccaryltransferase [Penicillium capsulatum]|uniref:Dolichyl-diphosphooligosaccharide--protein glycosyltransferase subunit 4 n=1 Tax=Penicillium capsulatum TaxID=69766 RepID=A0A9W9LZP1_9EURO|nr:Oligosaccaryltransferase [Penicillium capsulatum]KAJ6129242.1 Oligosaccaryltransferase [Penicillium capsulatum]